MKFRSNTARALRLPLGLMIVLTSGCNLTQPKGTQSSHEQRTYERKSTTCIDNCIGQGIEKYPSSHCLEECQKKRELLDLDPSVCEDICKQTIHDQKQFLALQCKSQCLNDDDRDGVPNQLDDCDNTGPSVAVNMEGCADGDGDGVADTADKCPGTSPGTDVDTDGCDITQTCSNGKCETYYPSCSTEEECDRNKEVLLTRQVPLARRQQLIHQMLEIRQQDVVCPSDDAAPRQPKLLQPSKAIDAHQIGGASVTFSGGSITGGTTVPLDFEWGAVSDPCPPVKYSIYLQYYYCDSISGVNEATQFYSNGWCRWMPLEYQTTSQTTFHYDFDFGQFLYNIHQPFMSELRWSPPQDGVFQMGYRPFWISVTMIAHDGNARSSSFGEHELHNYIVLYEKAQLDELSHVPIAP